MTLLGSAGDAAFANLIAAATAERVQPLDRVEVEAFEIHDPALRGDHREERPMPDLVYVVDSYAGVPWWLGAAVAWLVAAVVVAIFVGRAVRQRDRQVAVPPRKFTKADVFGEEGERRG